MTGVRAAIVVALLAAASAWPAAQQTRELPNVRELGAALVAFDDGLVHAVAAYYYVTIHNAASTVRVPLDLM